MRLSILDLSLGTRDQILKDCYSLFHPDELAVGYIGLKSEYENVSCIRYEFTFSLYFLLFLLLFLFINFINFILFLLLLDASSDINAVELTISSKIITSFTQAMHEISSVLPD
jgi:hypothetical protein